MPGHWLVIWISSLVLIAAGCDSKRPVQKPAGTSPRIASLVPAVTDLIAAMGAADHLVAVSNLDKGIEVQDLPRVGDYESIDWEKLSAARPEVMIIFMSAGRMPAGIKQRADGLGIELVNIKTDRVADIFSTIEYLGRLIKQPDKASALSRRLQSQLDAVAIRVRGKEPVPTLLAISDNSFSLIGGETFANDLLTIAGGVNVAPATMKGYPAADAERVMELAPQAVIQLIPDASKQAADRAAKMWEKLPDLPATKAHRIYLLSDWYVWQPGSHIGDLAESMAGKLHPQ